MILNPLLKKSFLYVWLIFIGGVALLSLYVSAASSAWRDFLVLFFCFVFCLSMQKKDTVDMGMLLSVTKHIGIFVSITVILGASTNIFRTELLGFYSSAAQTLLLTRSTENGGIFPYVSYAGCFICSGIGAFFIDRFYLGKKKFGLIDWIQLLILFTAFIFIRKRGFTFDLILSFLFVRLVSRTKGIRLNITRILRIILIVVFIVGIFAALYFSVDVVHTMVDAYIMRFFKQDETLSGRTLLYELAFSLFKTRPITGIGWGRYRAHTEGFFGINDMSYAAHNVYLQLLCETGVLGLCAFLLAVGVTLFVSVRKYRKLLFAGADHRILACMRYSLFHQIFFLTYSFSGNPLYDRIFLVTYFVGVLFCVIVRLPEETDDAAKKTQRRFYDRSLRNARFSGDL